MTVTLKLGRCLCVLLNRPFPLDLLARQTGRPKASMAPQAMTTLLRPEVDVRGN